MYAKAMSRDSIFTEVIMQGDKIRGESYAGNTDSIL